MKVQSCSKRVPNQARRSSYAPTLAHGPGERGQLPLAAVAALKKGLPGSGTIPRYLLLIMLCLLLSTTPTRSMCKASSCELCGRAWTRSF